MPVSFPSPAVALSGREEYISRFQARLEHFPVFLYGGIAGIGKTSLILRLAKETKALGLRGAVYLPLRPGEAITSILARVEAHSGDAKSGRYDRQGDPYSRLTDHLEEKRLALVLDDVHHVRREDLLALVRACRHREGQYRVLAAGRGEPDLPAIDRMSLHMERVGPLKSDEVSSLASSLGAQGEILDLLVADAERGGCTGHPLTLIFLIDLFASELPPPSFFQNQSSRSVSAFKALLTLAGDRLVAKDATVLASLAVVGMPVSKSVATRVFGAPLSKLIKRRLLSMVGDDVYAHDLIGQALVDQQFGMSETAAKALADHFKERGEQRREPLFVLRAAEILAKVGATSQAVDTLTTVWLTARDFGFLEAYLKAVASIPKKPALVNRLKLLSARARMRQGNVQSVRDELEALAKDSDTWTRSRALAALTFVYSRLGDDQKVVAAYESVKRTSVSVELSVPAATLAATAMVRIGKIADAEKLARSVVGKIKSNPKLFEQQGELHRLLARIYARSGRLDNAVTEAQAAAKAFEAAGDLYHAATAHGFIGDLYRETGDFELAKAAFVKFHDLAEKWGDRDLLQVAELADAWVSLDVGDLTHAAKQIAAVEKDMSAAPSRRLKRYLAAARALLEAGRGHHDVAASALVPVIDAWEGAGQKNIADILRAQRVRSLIACNDLDTARSLVDEALTRLDPKVEAPRVASFLRESALIRLRRKDVKKAMAELAQAGKLFAQGGNRREEALTLYRIAHAAFEEGDIPLASARVKEAHTLGRKIKHTRVIAQCRELMGRIALVNDDPKKAVAISKEALQSLRKLGDELGTLHVSESLLRSLIAAGDLAGAIRLGPRVSDHADKLEIRSVRVRAIVLTGVALLRKGRVDPASRCFREIPDQALTPLTRALMWRFGEALASVLGNLDDMLERRRKWVAALKQLPDAQQQVSTHLLEQLDLPPRERCMLRMPGESRLVDTEELAWLELERNVNLFVDVENRRVVDSGQDIVIDSPGLLKMFNRLVITAPEAVASEHLYEATHGESPAAGKVDKKLKASIKQLEKQLKNASHIQIEDVGDGMKLILPQSYAFLVPRAIDFPTLKATHRHVLRLLRRFGTMPIQAIQERLGVNRSIARRELAELTELGLIETIRDGRGQAFRLA